jgi:hypothetical protein
MIMTNCYDSLKLTEIQRNCILLTENANKRCNQRNNYHSLFVLVGR